MESKNHFKTIAYCVTAIICFLILGGSISYIHIEHSGTVVSVGGKR